MKTPREILLQKHQAVQPKLDQLRRETLNELERGCVRGEGTSRSTVELTDPLLLVPHPNTAALRKERFTFFVSQLWRELILPSRRIWSGLAAAWVVIIFANLSDSEPSINLTTAQLSQPVPEMIETIHERQRLIAEFMAENTLEEPADRPHPVLHPRSERRLNFKLA